MKHLLKQWKVVTILILSGINLQACSESDYSFLPDTSSLSTWYAGDTVSAKAIETFGGIDKCFAAEPIPDGVWARMQGKTYKENPHIGRDDLRHVRALHWDYDEKIHIGEMVCNKMIAERVAHILRELYEAKYPIQRMLLPDVYNADDETQMRDNNSSCFCYRAVAGTTKLSKHARGLAVDINTLYNPYYKDRPDGTRFIQPATAEEYCDRTKDFPYKIDHDDLCFLLFREAGFEWGGDWTTCKDYQHFELIEQPTVQRIVERGKLLVGTTGDYRPLSYCETDGSYWGFGIEMAEMIAKRIGVNIEYIPTSWPTLTADVLTEPQTFDLAIGGITITETRKETMLMSNGYLTNGKTILCRSADANRFQSLADINKPEVRVMVNPGGLNEKFAKENLTNATIIVYQKNEEIPNQVAEGNADVMITEITEAPWYVKNDTRLAAPLINTPFTHGEIGVLMRKGQEDLLSLVNTVIAQMKSDGSLRELHEKYGLVYGYE